MNIIIIGAGEVGFQIAERLVLENHDVVIVDKDPEKILEINRSLDVLTIIGQGGDFNVLNKAGIRNCDILIAATDVDETNMIACYIAKKFNVPSKIARIRNYFLKSENQDDDIFTKDELGIDVLINSEYVATDDIIKLIHSPAAFEIVDFPEEELIIKGFRITPGLDINNQKLKDLINFPELNKMLVLAIIRNDEMIIPRGDSNFQTGDKVYIIAKTIDFPKISSFFDESQHSIRSVFVVGANKFSRLLCKHFQEMDIHVKVIEPDRNKCLAFSEEYHNIDVVNCSPTDLEALKEEGLENIDAFIALSDDEENNILSSMLAKKQKVRKTIAKIQKNDYLPFTSIMGIDAVINPKLSTVGGILKYVRRGNVLSVSTLGEKNAEIIEYLITGKNKLIGIPFRKIKFPPGCLVAAIMRVDEQIIPKGDDTLQIGDRIIVFVSPEAVNKVGKLFG
ncbi:MAG: Trk system potassium transporter TrkA [Spirochaetota bacterium]|nr:Trk system potassium transporter TrkA [Spirochaetota bacterium]